MDILMQGDGTAPFIAPPITRLLIQFAPYMEKDFGRWSTHKKFLDSSGSSPDFHEREIWWCSIGVNVGSEQHSQTGDFSRPVLVVRKFSRDMFWGIPLTTKLSDAPFRFRFTFDDLANDALILQMRAYDRKRLVRKIGRLPGGQFKKLVKLIQGLW